MKIGLLLGDGIGPEVISSTRKVLESLDLDLEFYEFPIGLGAYDEYGSYLPEQTLSGLKDMDCSLLGAVTSPPFDIEGYQAVVPFLRRYFDLYANVRPAISLLPTKKLPLRKDLDVLIVRENTEGLYSQVEREIDGGFEAGKVVTRAASERICRFAFESAEKLERNKVTCVHKANVLRGTDGLFARVFNEVAEDYPDIEVEECFVDACAMFLVRDPDRFEVIVTMNLYGDILSDLCAGLIGGMGYAPSGNIGDNFAIFEPVHGSAPDIAGQNIANPTAALLSAAMMLEHMELPGQAWMIRDAIEEVVAGGSLTRDVGGTLGTKEFTDEVIKYL